MQRAMRTVKKGNLGTAKRPTRAYTWSQQKPQLPCIRSVGWPRIMPAPTRCQCGTDGHTQQKDKGVVESGQALSATRWPA